MNNNVKIKTGHSNDAASGSRKLRTICADDLFSHLTDANQIAIIERMKEMMSTQNTSKN